MSTLSDLLAARRTIEGLAGDPGIDPIELTVAVTAALAPPAPGGSPAAIRAQAGAYRQAATRCAAVAADLAEVANAALPSAWKGQVAQTAGQAVQALSVELATAQSALAEVAAALESWARDLEWAQQRDQDGTGQLENARQIASGYDMTTGEPAILAVPHALAGLAARVSAAQRIEDAAPGAIGKLHQYAVKARARRAANSGLDPLGAVVLATETKPSEDGENEDILSSTALALGKQRLSGMSAADRASLETLLAGCESPDEAAYVWKAMAAGYSLSRVQAFDAAIRPTGDSPLWLADHLAPDFDEPDATTDTAAGKNLMTYEGTIGAAFDALGFDLYNQGLPGDCVAASTVIAQAGIDPVLMLELTTGLGGPGGSKPVLGDDSAAAFQQRLQQAYLKDYRAGQSADGFWANLFGHSSGVGAAGENTLANQDLDGATGSTYRYQDLNSAADRQAALPAIEAAVDSGKPVLFDVTNGADGHQMLVVAHAGDRLEVYNPWGFTQWITERQFVDSRLGALTTDASGAPDGLPTAEGVELPR